MSKKVSRFIKILRRQKPKLSRDYQIKSLGIFGSYLYNKQRAKSDLDILVEFRDPPSLFRFIELESRLIDLLGVKVDLVMKDALKPVIGRRILSEVIPI